MEFGKNIKLIIFDFDGTLHDLKLDWSAARRILGIEGTSESMGDAIDNLKRKNNTRPLKKLTQMEEEALAGSELDPVTKQTLQSLKQKYTIAIFSRNSGRAIEHFLERNGAPMDYVVGREDVTRLKPDPEGVQKIIRYFGLKSEQVLFVGDTWHDLLVAKTVGIKCVIVGNNFKHDNEVPEHRVAAIKDLGEVL
jgi:phosphoglycolate phosphatase